MVAQAALAAPGPDRVALEMLEGREVSVTPNAGVGPVMLATRVADPGTWAVLVVWGVARVVSVVWAVGPGTQAVLAG